MKENYEDLAALLKRRLDVIADHELRESNPAEQLRQLKEVSEGITAWHREHRDEISSQLSHFLTNASLVKALQYLESEERVKCR